MNVRISIFNALQFTKMEFLYTFSISFKNATQQNKFIKVCIVKDVLFIKGQKYSLKKPIFKKCVFNKMYKIYINVESIGFSLGIPRGLISKTLPNENLLYFLDKMSLVALCLQI